MVGKPRSVGQSAEMPVGTPPGALAGCSHRQPQVLGMPVFYWRLMRAHGLSAAFTVDAGCKAFAVSAL